MKKTVIAVILLMAFAVAASAQSSSDSSQAQNQQQQAQNQQLQDRVDSYNARCSSVEAGSSQAAACQEERSDLLRQIDQSNQNSSGSN